MQELERPKGLASRQSGDRVEEVRSDELLDVLSRKLFLTFSTLPPAMAVVLRAHGCAGAASMGRQ